LMPCSSASFAKSQRDALLKATRRG
jgi:hypothetical protein